MARLRQYFANRYSSAEATSAEFEQLIRYLNAAELGNLTLPELLQKVFDDDGNVDLNVTFKFDGANGLQYSFDGINFSTAATAAEIQGAPGLSVGTIDSPMFTNRQDLVATASQTVFPYTMTSGAADVMVYANGLLMSTAEYTYNSTSGLLTLLVGRALNDKITVQSVRNNSSSTYRRVDLVANSGQAVFPFTHTSNETLYVWRNGLLQRQGGSFDFITTPGSATVTMNVAQSGGNIITIICVNNSAVRDVAGIMLEDRYATGGLIRLDRISLADDAIAQAKVNGLVAALALRADVYVAASTPAGAIRSGSLWVNTSRAVPNLNFYDGARWLDSSPNGLIPLPQSMNALQFIRLNATATALEYVSLDFSSLLAASELGNPNGVCPLDSGAKVPLAALPDFSISAPIIGFMGTVTNGTYPIGRIFGRRYSFNKVSAILGAGTATLQFSVAGVDIGTPIAASTAAVDLTLTPVVRDAIAAGQTVSVTISAAAGASNLSYCVGGTITG